MTHVPILHKLYKHHVAKTTAADVGALRGVDSVMSQIMDKALEEVMGTAAAACAKAAFAALQNTLLNGGEFRNFAVEDADALQADLQAFKVGC